METMEILKNIELIVPLEQVVILVALILVSVFIGRVRQSLSITLFFILYWVFIHNREAFASSFESSPGTVMIYVLSGAVIFLLSLFLFLVHTVSRD